MGPSSMVRSIRILRQFHQRSQDNAPVPVAMRLQRRRRALLGYLNLMGAMIFMLGIVSWFAYLAARRPDFKSGMPFIDNTSEVLRRYLNAMAWDCWICWR